MATTATREAIMETRAVARHHPDFNLAVTVVAARAIVVATRVSRATRVIKVIRATGVTRADTETAAVLETKAGVGKKADTDSKAWADKKVATIILATGVATRAKEWEWIMKTIAPIPEECLAVTKVVAAVLMKMKDEAAAVVAVVCSQTTGLPATVRVLPANPAMKDHPEMLAATVHLPAVLPAEAETANHPAVADLPVTRANQTAHLVHRAAEENHPPLPKNLAVLQKVKRLQDKVSG